MANLSELTRKEQVRHYLEARKDEWVNGPDIANETVGGSEGQRRVRDLRADGYRIEARKHPDPDRDIWQYRMVDAPTVSPIKETNESRNHQSTSGGSAGWGDDRPRAVARGEYQQWTSFNHSFGPWYRSIVEWRREKVEATVQPDMGREGWYWSVRFPAYRPKKLIDSRGRPTRELPEYKRGGRATTIEDAKLAAIAAVMDGRP